MTETHDFTSERRTAVNLRRHTDYAQCPKFDRHELSEDQIIEIAKKAVTLAREEFYQEVGKSVTSKFFVLVGLMAMTAMVWLTKKGYIG
jgi:hypothetical protein